MANQQDDGTQPPQPLVVTRLIQIALPGASAIKALTAEESQIVARHLLTDAKGMKEVDLAMRRHGLVGMPSRARSYAPFSKTRGRTKHVAIVPYSSSDPDSKLVGGVGVSEGEAVTGTIVEMRGTQILSVTTLGIQGGKLVEEKILARELLAEGPQKFVNKRLQRGKLERDLTVDTSMAIAGDAFRALLFDEYSTMIHSPSDLRELAYGAPLVSAIAELQYRRQEGLVHSPDGSCCCCCSCCWGSCSCCSATSTKYVNEAYRQSLMP
jgi:hypothetical protein